MLLLSIIIVGVKTIQCTIITKTYLLFIYYYLLLETMTMPISLLLFLWLSMTYSTTTMTYLLTVITMFIAKAKLRYFWRSNSTVRSWRPRRRGPGYGSVGGRRDVWRQCRERSERCDANSVRKVWRIHIITNHRTIYIYTVYILYIYMVI